MDSITMSSTASGLSGSKETAQSQVTVGMGLMARSNFMLLTIVWGSCHIAGKSDIEGSKAADSRDTKTFSLTGSGVTTDIWTSYAARIMVLSVIPFIVVQLPQIFNITSQSRVFVPTSLVLSLCLMLCYSLYQVLQPWIQKRRIAFAKHKHVVSGILKHLKMEALGRLLKDNGEPNRQVIQNLFKSIDANSDGKLTVTELKALVIGIQFEDIDLDYEGAVNQVLRDFDTSGDSHVEIDEFVNRISKWLTETRHSATHSNKNEAQSNLNRQTSPEHAQPGDQNADIATKSLGNPKWNATKAVLMLFLGTVIAAAFADPLVDAVDNFSTASSIPSFFVSFVILPFASASELVTDLTFSSRKNSKSTSLAYSEIYGSLTMGNVLSLTVFLGLVYFRDLTWDFSSDVLVIIVICVVIGLIAGFRTTFPLWMSLVAYALYPFSLALAYVLEYVVGWA